MLITDENRQDTNVTSNAVYREVFHKCKITCAKNQRFLYVILMYYIPMVATNYITKVTIIQLIFIVIGVL